MPFGEHHFAITQLSFPLLSPVCAQTTRHDHTDKRDQPEPRASCRLRTHFSLSVVQVCWLRSDQTGEADETVPALPPMLSDRIYYLRNTPAVDVALPGRRGDVPISSR